MKLFVFIILTSLQVFITLVPIFAKPTKEEEGKFKTTNWGSFMMTLSIICLGLTLTLYFLSESEQEKATLKFKEALDTRDTLHYKREDSLANAYTKQIDSSYTRSIKASNKALANYNLILVDSLRTVAKTINSSTTPFPQLSIRPITDGRNPIYLEDTIMKVQFVSFNATAYSINLDLFLWLESPNGSLILFKDKLVDKDKFLDPTVILTSMLPIPSPLLKIESFQLSIFGSFSKDQKGKDTIPFHQSFIYKRKGKVFEQVSIPFKDVKKAYDQGRLLSKFY